jgi:phospholipid/cholesterol/gamma-HCH transport system permease protein
VAEPRMGWLKRATLEVQEYLELLGQVLRALVTPPLYARDAIEQLDAIGIGSLTVVLLTGTFTGMVLALQMGKSLDQFGARTMVGAVVSASMVRELGPVLTALMVTGRVGSGIAAELVVPRVLAGTIMVPVLTVVSDAVGMVGGAAISRIQLHVAGSVYWNNVVEALYVQDLWMGVLKPLVLGFLLVTIGCHVGMRTKGGTQGVGRATTNAVVAGSVAVLAVDFLLTKLLITIFY